MDKETSGQIQGQVIETSPISYKQQVKRLILEQLRKQKLKPKQKIPTIRQLADTLRVSKSTVGAVLRELVQEGVIYSRVGKGSFILGKSPQIKAKNKVLGIRIGNLNNPAFAEFAQVVGNLAHRYGYSTPLFDNSEHGERNLRQVIKEKRIDGIIGILNNQMRRRVMQADIPWVALSLSSRWRDNRNIDTVSCNIEKASFLLVSHLVSLGHKKIAISTVKGGGDNKLKEFKNAFTHFSLPFKENMVIEESEEIDPLYPDWYKLIGRDILRKVLNLKELPTAFIVSNDARAIGVLKEAEEQGIKVPEDMAIVSFDNISLSSSLKPSLTTVDLRYIERAKKAFHLLLERLEGKRKKGNRHIEFAPKLIIRDSCGYKRSERNRS